MFAHEFMRHAFLAGTAVAVACGLVGHFVVLRGQVFAGDALSHVAFTGALAAAAAGVDVRLGLFVAVVGVGAAIGALGGRADADDVVIGSVFAWVLGLGVLFLALYTTHASGNGDGAAGVRVLFGSVLGLSTGQTWVAVGIAVGVAVAVAAIARPLLFSSIDPDVARAQGVPVRALGMAFLALTGVVAGEATQVVGALMLLGLLAAPAGAAAALTAAPGRGLALSCALAVASVWIGLTLSYAISALPPSSAITGVAAAIYAAARLAGRRGGVVAHGANEAYGRAGAGI
jgi:zinc/manganese transport system permease protein